MTARRRWLITLGGLLLAPSLPCAAQPAKVYRIGYMSQQSRASEKDRIEGFLQGLRELGYVEGRNIAIEYRHADGVTDRLSEFAADFVRLEVDLIVAVGTPATLVAQKATRTIPIVFPISGDPRGLVASLARPGGNTTGFTSLGSALDQKRLEVIKETVPGLSKVAVLWNSKNPTHGPAMEVMKLAADNLGLQLQWVDIKAPEELEQGFAVIVASRAHALLSMPDETFHTRRKQIAAFAIENRLPAMFYSAEWVEDGILMSYGVHVAELYRRAAGYVDKILKGARPGDLPVEQASTFQLVINLKTARTIGIRIPQSIASRADRVIR